MLPRLPTFTPADSEYLLSSVFQDLDSLCELYADDGENSLLPTTNVIVPLSSLLERSTATAAADNGYLLSSVFRDIDSLCEVYADDEENDRFFNIERFHFGNGGPLYFFDLNLVRRYFNIMVSEHSSDDFFHSSDDESSALSSTASDDSDQQGSFECLICSARSTDRVVLTGCGHAVSCRRCTSALSKCSVCRSRIRSKPRAVYQCRDSELVENCDACSAKIAARVHFLPCCHAYTCEPCSTTLDVCPTCGVKIGKKTVLYMDV